MAKTLYALEIAARDAGDPIVFHGTSVENAEPILQDGTAHDVRIKQRSGPSYFPGLYFGTLSSALGMAEKTFTYPVLLAIRVSQLESAGSLFSDVNIVECGSCRLGKTIWADREDPVYPEDFEFKEDDVVDMSWDTSLNTFGTLAWVGSGPIAEMVLLSPADEDLDVVIRSLSEMKQDESLEMCGETG